MLAPWHTACIQHNLFSGRQELHRCPTQHVPIQSKLYNRIWSARNATPLSLRRSLGSAAGTQLEGAKSQVADGAERIADAVERTADELDGDGDGRGLGYGRSLASMMRQLAGGMRERDIDEFATELSSFARQHPGAFLAGSVALGFGISRFMKASNRRAYDDTDDGSPRDPTRSLESTEDPFDLGPRPSAGTEAADAP